MLVIVEGICKLLDGAWVCLRGDMITEAEESVEKDVELV